LLVLVIAVLVVAHVASVVVFGYPALIVGALIGVALAFVALLALTADGLVARKDGAPH
jgi:hypothetical protein